MLFSFCFQMKNLLNQIIILALFLLVGCAKPNNSAQESLSTPIIITALIIFQSALKAFNIEQKNKLRIDVLTQT